MIPTDLKPGAVVRCTRRATRLPEGEYVLKGYVAKPVWYRAMTSPSALIEGKPNHMNGGDQGWMLDRFKLIRDGDGSDYQGPDDVDLVSGSQADDYPPASIRRAL
jgi:hypothetical protein